MKTGWRMSVALLAGAAAGMSGQTGPSLPDRVKPEAAAPGGAITPIVVEDEATTAKARIRSEGTTLLNNRDYRGLDALASQLAQSTQTFAQGDWPIGFFYSEVADLPKKSTQAEWEEVRWS